MSGETEKKISRLFIFSQAGKKKSTIGRPSLKRERPVHPMVIRLGLALIVALTAVILVLPSSKSMDFGYKVGDIAERDIKAERDLMVLDRMATLERRQDARRESPTVYDLDDLVAKKAEEDLHEIFSLGRRAFDEAPLSSPAFEPLGSEPKADPELLSAAEERFKQTFSVDPDDRTFDTLRRAHFSIQLERTILKLTVDLMRRGIVAERAMLLDQPGGIVVRRMSDGREDSVAYLDAFPSLEDARRAVMERALLYRDDFEARQIKAIVMVAQSLLTANLKMNMEETDSRRQSALEKVSPVFFQVKRGEMIVREGERVDEVAHLKLEAQAREALQDEGLPQAGGVFLLVLLLMGVTYAVSSRVALVARLRDRDVIFLATLLVVNLLLVFAASLVGDVMGRDMEGLNRSAILFLTPVASSGMLATIFLGAGPGMLFSVTITALTGLMLDHSLALFFYYFLGTITGLAGVIRVRERGAVIKSGVMISLVNIAVIVSLGLLEQTLTTSATLYALVGGLLNGFLVCIVVTGLIPFFEMLFRYTTDIKLLELANLDRPILRELMVQAPGTYHHSVIVGAMVEAAAEAIGANPLLAKVSAYYHDLGKIKKPLYFVENQGTGQNKHEKLAPSMSSLILISHVKDGVELARQHKLSQEIVDIIQQHHGTSLIAFFYQKAQNARTDDQPEINIEDYRYPGPKPQTREAGLIMLADAVEAASRTVNEPTPARVQGMVQKIINNIFSDGQLDECELTLKDLHLIARSFNKILTGIFHRRIEYPEPATKEGSAKAKTANESQTKQSAKEPQDKGRADQGSGKEDLKRLGIS